MIALVLLLVAAAPTAKHFERVKDFETQNKQGQYTWFSNRYALLEDLTHLGNVKGLVETVELTVLDTKDLSTHKLSFALANWANQHAELFFGGRAWIDHPRAPGRYLGRVDFPTLIHADGEQAWIIVKNGDGNLGDDSHGRDFLVRTSDGASVLIANTQYTSATERFICAGDGQLYFERAENNEVTLMQVDPLAMTTRDLATFKASRPGGYWYPSTDFTRFAYAEYSEKSQGVLDPPAKIHVRVTNEQFEVPAPVSPYGGAWTLDGTTFFIGSNELGTVQRLDVAKKELSEVAKGLRGIQGFQLTPNGKILMVMTRGATVARFSVAPFKALKPLVISTFIPGKKRYYWDWSEFSPDRTRALLSKNTASETADFLDSETPGVTLFKVLDE